MRSVTWLSNSFERERERERERESCLSFANTCRQETSAVFLLRANGVNAIHSKEAKYKRKGEGLKPNIIPS